MGKLFVATVVGLLILVGVIWQTEFRPKPPVQQTMNAVECLARNLAYETLANSHQSPAARQELEAIVHVVLQRKQLGRKAGYRDTVCDVIYQRNQFSWTLKGHLRTKVPEDKARWAYMLRVSQETLGGHFQYPWPKSHECIVTYKRADDQGVGKKPAAWFRKHMKPVTIIGSHKFFCAKKAPQQKEQKATAGPPKKRA